MPATISRFKSEPTKEYKEMVAAIRDMVKNEGLSEFQTAYAEASTQLWLKTFSEAKGWTQSQGAACIQKVIGRRCGLGVDPKGCECHPPGHDHFTMWNKDGRPVAYTFQPYSLESNTVRALNDFCDKHGLEYTITNQGAWYYPSWAFMVVITAQPF